MRFQPWRRSCNSAFAPSIAPGLNVDGGLVECSKLQFYKKLEDGLAATIVNGVSLLVENKAAEDETTFNQPTGDAGGSVVAILPVATPAKERFSSHFHGSTDLSIIHHALQFRWFGLLGAFAPFGISA